VGHGCGPGNRRPGLGAGAVLLFALISFLALSEFISLTPTGHGDHRTLLSVFFVVTPIQYWLSRGAIPP
jgi:phosphatidate cytidylyltransferase